MAEFAAQIKTKAELHLCCSSFLLSSWSSYSHFSFTISIPPQPFPPKNDRISQRPMLCSPRRRRLLYCLNRNWKWCQDQETVICGISKCDALRPILFQIHHFVGGYFGGSDTLIGEMRDTQNPINNASCQVLSTDIRISNCEIHSCSLRFEYISGGTALDFSSE